eukprot:975544_1
MPWPKVCTGLASPLLSFKESINPNCFIFSASKTKLSSSFLEAPLPPKLGAKDLKSIVVSSTLSAVVGKSLCHDGVLAHGPPAPFPSLNRTLYVLPSPLY